MNDTEQLTTPNPFALTTMESAEKMAGWIAESGCFGIKKPAQALTLMMIAHSESQTLAQSLKRYHCFDDGKLSQRADYTQSAFEKNGSILWHIRTDEMVAASFFKAKPIDEEMRKRAKERFALQWKLDGLMHLPKRDYAAESEIVLQLSELAFDGEVTIIRTLADAVDKGITEGKNGIKNNWKAGSVSMLQWRCATDGVKLIDASVMSGLSSDVDLQDATVVEQRIQSEQKSPQQRDRESIQAMIDQYLEEANTTKSQTRKSELLGLAAELRCKLAEMDAPKSEPKQIEPVKQEPVKQEPTKQAEPPKVVDATDATVEAPNVPHGTSPAEDHIPGLDLPLKSEVAAPTPWQQHEISTFRSSSYKGKKLGKLSPEEIEVLHNSAQKKLADGRKEKDFLLEAAQISLAYEATKK